MSDISKFIWSVQVKYILLGNIFHNHQTNNYMTSPVSVPLNVLRIARNFRLPFIIVQI